MRFSLKGLGRVMGCAATLWAGASFGGVNVNNGNFYIAYTDFLVQTPGLNIDITRTYNSRSNYVRGFFGVGWSSEIESYLSFEKDVVSLSEGGGGNIVRFEPVKGKPGTWANGVFGNQTLTKEKTGGYVLETATAKVMSFSDKGRLLRIADRNKNVIELVYKGDRIDMIKDNLNNQIKVTWKENVGRHPRIETLQMGPKKARYEYSNVGNLTKAAGADGIQYVYAYDDEHNMTKISYANGSFKEMGYNKGRDWVTSFRDQDGTRTSYDYFSDTLDPENKFGTTVTRVPAGSTNKEIARFWYEFRKRADGSRYNYKAVTEMRDVVTETLFTECCGTPLVITQWKSVAPKAGETTLAWTTPKADKRSTKFEYFEDGLLRRKTAADGTITALTYDTKHKKVASVDRGGRKVEYNYDPRGNLAWAFDVNDKRRLDLTYDVKGRITVVQEKRPTMAGPTKIFFRYDAMGRPVEIKETPTNAKESIIRFAYGSEGEVVGVLNAQGRAVASQVEVQSAQRVAATFQNLLQIVQPTGVTLTPEG